MADARPLRRNAAGPRESTILNPLKIMLVEFGPSGGLFHFSVQLGEALAARGHDVELVTGPDPELPSRQPGLRILPILPTWHPAAGAGDRLVKRRARRLIRAARYHLACVAVLRHVRRTRPDLVQFSSGRFPIDGLLWYWLTRGRRRRPMVVGLAHAPVPFNEQRATGDVFKGGPLLHRSLSLGYRSLDAVMVLGEQTATDLRAAWPGVRRLAVVSHGDEGVFLRGEPVPASGTEPVVLFFGTMQAYKGLDLLLEAFARVRAQYPEARLVVAGSPSGDTDLAGVCRTAKRIGGVEVRAGYVPVADVSGLFQSARVVVAPYRYANASGVVELAHTFARPVVATAVGDLPAVVQHGSTGLLVPPGDPDALAEALLDLLRRPSEAERLGEGGRERSLERASWSTVAEQVEAVYQQCRDGRSEAPLSPDSRR